jgi:UDP-glucose 4-epimerase
MTIVGDGEQRRDFTYISDVVEANIMAEKSDIKFGIYNVGTGKNYSINEIANFIGDHKIYVDERPAEVRETLADIESTIQDIGWKPKHDLSHIINQY